MKAAFTPFTFKSSSAARAATSWGASAPGSQTAMATPSSPISAFSTVRATWTKLSKSFWNRVLTNVRSAPFRLRYPAASKVRLPTLNTNCLVSSSMPARSALHTKLSGRTDSS